MTNDYSDSIEGALDRADALEQQGKRLEALELLQNLRSTDPIVLTRIGALQSDLERWEEAEATLLHAVTVDADLWAAHFYLGLVSRSGPIRSRRGHPSSCGSSQRILHHIEHSRSSST